MCDLSCVGKSGGFQGSFFGWTVHGWLYVATRGLVLWVLFLSTCNLHLLRCHTQGKHLSSKDLVKGGGWKWMTRDF